MTAGNSRSAAWLRGVQNDDGGWGFAAKSASDPDSTGAVLQALGAVGRRRPASSAASPTCAACSAPAGASRSPAARSTRSRPPGRRRACSRRASRPRRCAAAARRSATSASTQARDGHYRYSSTQRPDPGLGDRAGPDGRERRGLPAQPRAEGGFERGTRRCLRRRWRRRRGGGGGTGAKAKPAGQAPRGSRRTAGRAAGTAVPVAPASSSDSGDGGGGGDPGWLIALAYRRGCGRRLGRLGCLPAPPALAS